MPKYMLNVPATLLALILGLTVAGALPASALAQPAKPKPAATETQNDSAGDVQGSAGAGKKVKTEGQKAGDVKAKPKPAEEDGTDPVPAAPGKPGTSAPPPDR